MVVYAYGCGCKGGVARSIATKLLTCAFCVGRAAATSADAPDRNALQLHLQDLMLDNVDALEALKLNIQVSPFLHMLSSASVLPSTVASVHICILAVKCKQEQLNEVWQQQTCMRQFHYQLLKVRCCISAAESNMPIAHHQS